MVPNDDGGGHLHAARAGRAASGRPTSSGSSAPRPARRSRRCAGPTAPVTCWRPRRPELSEAVASRPAGITVVEVPIPRAAHRDLQADLRDAAVARPRLSDRRAAQNITAPTGSRSSLRAWEAAHSEPGVAPARPLPRLRRQGAGAEVRRGQRLHRQPQVGGVLGRDAPADAVVAGGEPPAPVVPRARVVRDVEHHVAGRGVAALREGRADVDQPQPQPVVRRRPDRARAAGPPDHRVVGHPSADPRRGGEVEVDQPPGQREQRRRVGGRDLGHRHRGVRQAVVAPACPVRWKRA